MQPFWGRRHCTYPGQTLLSAANPHLNSGEALQLPLVVRPLTSSNMQVLLHHLVGRQWRRKLEAPFPEEVAQILHWFGDQNSEPPRPFSVHALCGTGQRHG